MKKNGKYRFSLQFGADSEEQIRAGELLERLGNKKSQIVVASLNEYIAAHPELANGDCKIELRLTSEYDSAKLEQIIKAIVEKRFVEKRFVEMQMMVNTKTSKDTLDDDIVQMLDNLQLFE